MNFEKYANLQRAKGLLRAFGKEELPFVKDLIRSYPAGSPERFRSIMALRRAVKPERWSYDGPHRLTRLMSSSSRSGDPMILRGGHNPLEPLHFTGDNVNLPPYSSMDTGRNWAVGLEGHRHVTPWPNIANLYAEPHMGMHKGKSGNFGYVTTYKAKSFPEIAANDPWDHFTEPYLGLDRAIFRENPKSMDDFVRSMRESDAAWIRSNPYSSRFKSRIKDLREDTKDLIDDLKKDKHAKDKSHRRMRHTIQGAVLDERRSKLTQVGPLDQLSDRKVQDFVANRFPSDVNEHKYMRRWMDDFEGKAYEMVLNMKGRKPTGLFMTDYRSPGTYYDASGLMKTYQRAAESGNGRVKGLIENIFRRRFGYPVE